MNILGCLNDDLTNFRVIKGKMMINYEMMSRLPFVKISFILTNLKRHR